MSIGWCGGLVLVALVAVRAARDDEDGVGGRAELAARVARCLAERRAPSAPETTRLFGLELQVVSVEGVQALASGGAEEAREVARRLAAARALYGELTGSEPRYPHGLRVFLLDARAAKDAFLAQHPALAPEARERLARLECSGIEGTADWAFYQEDAEQRLDGALRLAFDWLMRAQGITLARHAWLHEGLGSYLTHALAGTNLTWMLPIPPARLRTSEDRALLTGMKEPLADWLALARTAFEPEPRFDLEELLHLTLDELDPRDHLRAYALAAFVLEVRPSALAPLLAHLGSGADPREGLEQQLGTTMPELRERLAEWLTRREELVARVEGRRTDAELEAQWQRLAPEQRRAAMSAFTSALAGLETQQLRTLRTWLARAPAEIATASERPFFDPKVHAPAQPIARKRLPSADARVKRLLKELRADAQGPVLAYDYDWSSARVVRVGTPDEPEAVFQNALLGLPPGADLLRALVLATLDLPAERKLQAAFAHAYTDREGNVFPVALYDMWATGQTIEMPDVDTLGILHDVKNEWTRWVAPVPGSEHDKLYRVLGELFAECRRSRELRLTLAELHLSAGASPRKGYESLAANLHALWAAHEADPAKLAATLPGGKDSDAFLRTLVERCQREYRYYAAGRRRAAELRRDGFALRQALGAALDAAEATPPAAEPSPPGR
jgi:hypothetical protein